MRRIDKIEVKENKYYVVKVQLKENGLIHKAIYFTGYSNGNYKRLIASTYTKELSNGKEDNIFIEIINEVRGIGTC